jgi:hypothetical protein
MTDFNMDHFPPDRVVFLSASIPDPERWAGEFDPFAITDAVVATARAVFSRGGAILTAAHPTIAPLILQVADHFPGTPAAIRVVLYQSMLFANEIPPATKRMMSRSYVRVVWTPAEPGETPVPGESVKSLQTMRAAMMAEVPISAAIFVGGMEGIRKEFDTVGQIHPDTPRLAVVRPGGAASRLPRDDLAADGFMESDLYPWMLEEAMTRILGPSASDRPADRGP